MYPNSKNFDRRLQPPSHGLALTTWFDKACQATTNDRALIQQVFNTLVGWKQEGFLYVGEPLDGREVIMPVRKRTTPCKIVAAVDSRAAAEHLMERLKARWRIGKEQ
jgi:hypothetical protein